MLISVSCGDSSASPDEADNPGASEEATVQYEASVLYERYCLSCHGEEGYGDGVSSPLLFIKPRDFSMGIFKFRTTLGGMPTDEDLYRTIEEGVGGTEMSPYENLPPEAINELVAYVKKLTVGEIEVADEEEAKELEGLQEVIEDDGWYYARINWFEFRGVGEKITVPEPPKPTQELVDRGKELFTGIATCNTCHGDEGLGDGTAGQDLVDDWGVPIKPRNFKEDQFKGGSDPEDLYLRVVIGIPGTPMPSSRGVITDPEDVWAIVYYVLKLKGRLYIPK
ncbi:MAG: cytochrome c [Planctomycetota bacterium]|jgi:cytochrome c oxidase cbb3-type subunit 2|nr:cytochrome c [Planctomycetota bacterium]